LLEQAVHLQPKDQDDHFSSKAAIRSSSCLFPTVFCAFLLKAVKHVKGIGELCDINYPESA
jgi:hypothetical protein